MKDLSSLSKAVIVVWCVGITNLLSVIAQVVQGDPLLSWGFALNAITAVILFMVRHYIMKVRNVIRDLVFHVDRWKKGDINDRLVHIKEKGNLGTLFIALNDFVDIVEASLRESIASMHAVSQGRYYRKIIKTGLGGTFAQSADGINQGIMIIEEKTHSLSEAANHLNTSVAKTVESVSHATQQVKDGSKTMLHRVQEAIHKGGMVLDHAQLTQGKVNAVSKSLDELIQAVEDITQQVQESTNSVNAAKERMKYTTQVMRDLTLVSTRINEVVEVINNIADQTNLLAINATIEAIREGVSGKGFSVVALEVKNLASQTMKAADQIIKQINEIQGSSKGATNAITELNEIIFKVNDAFHIVSSSVSQQGNTVQQISFNIQDLASSATTVISNITEITDIDKETYHFAKEVFKEIEGLSLKINHLQSGMNHFMHYIRSDGVSLDQKAPAKVYENGKVEDNAENNQKSYVHSQGEQSESASTLNI